MTRIYENRSLARRMNISSAVTAFAVLFGFWELFAAVRAGPEGAGYGFLFAALFIGGGIYGFNQIFSEASDMVTALDLDEAAGRATISIWRPFAPKRIEGTLDSLTEWRPYSKMARNVRTPMLLADHPGHLRPLQFEIGPGVMMSERFRAFDPEALATFEQGANAPGSAA
jgi:hypothetical protein